MKRTNFYFEPELLERVRAYAEATGQTSSDVIRTAIREHLDRTERVVEDFAVEEGMRQIAVTIRTMADALRGAVVSRPAVKARGKKRGGN